MRPMRRMFAGTALLCSLGAATALPALPAHAEEPAFQGVGLPFLWPSAGIADVTAFGPDDVWIGGGQGAFCIPQIASWGCYVSSAGNPVARRWTGARWQEYALPGYSGNGTLATVQGTAPDDVWAVAWQDGASRYLARFDGTAFTEVEPPPDSVYLDVFSGAGGTWLAAGPRSGGQALYRREGNAWARTVPASLTIVRNVRARTPTDVWATGTEPVGNGVRSALARWDGRSWQRVASPEPGEHIADVLPVSATEVWAVPDDDDLETAWRWDGSAWSRVAAPAGTELRHLAVDGAGTVWAGGREAVMVDGYTRYRPVLLYRDGSEWRRIAIALPWGANSMSVTGLAAVPGTGGIWVAANTDIGPRVLRRR
ncbi:hypothetical protein [Spirillospora sp. NPDC029432]|uniref:hypothetical protein n=1 Tax=Spirillospora sp. NPDC029432 TaxID=3154599 RepID=UPI00345461CA